MGPKPSPQVDKYMGYRRQALRCYRRIEHQMQTIMERELHASSYHQLWNTIPSIEGINFQRRTVKAVPMEHNSTVLRNAMLLSIIIFVSGLRSALQALLESFRRTAHDLVSS